MKTKIFYTVVLCLFFAVSGPSQSPFASVEAVTEPNSQPSQADPNDPNVKSGSKIEEGLKFEITMRILTVDKEEYQIIDGIWTSAPITRGYLTADYPEILDETQLLIGMAWAKFDEELNILKEKVKSAAESQTTITAVEAKPVYLPVGEKIEADKFFFYGRWYQAKDFKFKEAKKLLKITPLQIPEREFINLQITIVFSDFLSDGGSKEFSQMTAGITLRPGQPVVIGGPVKMDEYLGKALLISGENEKTTQSLIILTVKPADSN